MFLIVYSSIITNIFDILIPKSGSISVLDGGYLAFNFLQISKIELILMRLQYNQKVN